MTYNAYNGVKNQLIANNDGNIPSIDYTNLFSSLRIVPYYHRHQHQKTPWDMRPNWEVLEMAVQCSMQNEWQEAFFK